MVTWTNQDSSEPRVPLHPTPTCDDYVTPKSDIYMWHLYLTPISEIYFLKYLFYIFMKFKAWCSKAIFQLFAAVKCNRHTHDVSMNSYELVISLCILYVIIWMIFQGGEKVTVNPHSDPILEPLRLSQNDTVSVGSDTDLSSIASSEPTILEPVVHGDVMSLTR